MPFRVNNYYEYCSPEKISVPQSPIIYCKSFIENPLSSLILDMGCSSTASKKLIRLIFIHFFDFLLLQDLKDIDFLDRRAEYPIANVAPMTH